MVWNLLTGKRPRDPSSFEKDVLAHAPALLAVARRLTRSHADAEDLVQETLLRAMKASDRFDAGTNLKAWLFRIQTNTFITRYRRGGLERNLFEGPDADPLTDGWVSTSSLQAMRCPEEVALQPILAAELNRALAELPEDFRLPVLLADVEERSYREIAEMMDCPVGTVMSRLHRGRRLLRERLVGQAEALGLVERTLPEPELNDSKSAAKEPVSLEAFRARRTA